MNLTTVLCKKLNEEKWHNLSAGVSEEGGRVKGGGVSETLTDVTEKTIRGSKDSIDFICHVTLHGSEMLVWQHGCACKK